MSNKSFGINKHLETNYKLLTLKASEIVFYSLWKMILISNTILTEIDIILLYKLT